MREETRLYISTPLLNTLNCEGTAWIGDTEFKIDGIGADWVQLTSKDGRINSIRFEPNNIRTEYDGKTLEELQKERNKKSRSKAEESSE